MEKKKIKIDFVDFFGKLLRNKTNNLYYNWISELYDVEISEHPDFVICSTYDRNFLKYECPRIWIAGENVRPNFNLYDYAVGFDYMTFEDRYKRLPIYMNRAGYWEMALNKHLLSDEDISKKKGFCNFCYSNNDTMTHRDEFLRKLSEYKKVDSGGKYANNIGGPVKDKIEWQKGYKFSIAFENSVQNGYVTEKIADAFAAGTIPIYMGDPRILEEFNEEAFILCRGERDFDNVIQRVKEIDNDDELFMKMLRTPILKDPEGHERRYGKKAMQDFFAGIFEQDPQDAIRRNGYLWERREEEKELMVARLDKINPMKRVKPKLARMTYKLRHRY